VPSGEDLTPPKATWRWWEVAAFTLAGFLVGSIVAAPVFVALHGDARGPLDGPGAVTATVTYVVMTAILLLWLRFAHPGWWRVVGWPPRGARLREGGIGIGLGLVSQVLVTTVSAILIFALGVLGRHVAVPPQVESTLTGWDAVALVVYAVIMVPFTEELVFRGLLFHSIADRRGFWPGALASSVGFGLIHVVSGPALGVVVLVVTMTLNGIWWAWIHHQRRNLLVNVAIHATFNTVGVVAAIRMFGS
jgi:membrane protease YdiL (CAAX protease family)